MAYVRASYILAVELFGDDVQYNRSLARLRAVVSRSTPAGRPGARLHPHIELFISHRARRHALERSGDPNAPVTQVDIDLAAKYAAQTLRTRRGAPEAAVLRHHVEGLMALLQELSGRPARAGRHKNDRYDPHFPDGVSEIIPRLFQAIDKRISNVRLVNIVLSARRKYAGKPMRFLDFFPAYGGSVDEDGTFDPAPGLRVEQFEPSIPIYCP
ncbi:MAG: hypothetical protein AB7V46_01945 [Thermomicrobiales bacterium]